MSWAQPSRLERGFVDAHAVIGWRTRAHRLQDQLVAEYGAVVPAGRVRAVTARRLRDSYRERGARPQALALAESRARLVLGTIRPPMA
jgi:hypothetical protein